MIKYKVGDIISSRQSGPFEVLSREKGKAQIKFVQTGHIIVVDKSVLRTGKVSDPMLPTIFGLGYYGDGSYTESIDTHTKAKALETWHSMFKRCYEGRFPAYQQCEVHPEWHDFQNFARFFCEDKFRKDGWELDKDLLVKGNKLYSSNTCVFLPVDINGTIKTNKSRRGNLLIGVRKRHSGGKYKAVCRDVEGVQQVIGTYDTEYEAFLCYKRFKESVINKKALIWKDSIDPRAFSALMSYVVEESD